MLIRFRESSSTFDWSFITLLDYITLNFRNTNGKVNRKPFVIEGSWSTETDIISEFAYSYWGEIRKNSQNNLCSIRDLKCKPPEETRSAIQPACVEWETLWIFNRNHEDEKSECKVSGRIAQMKIMKLSENLRSGYCWESAYWRIALKLNRKDFQKHRTCNPK